MLRAFGVIRLDIADSCVYSESITSVATSTAVTYSTSPVAIPISSSTTVSSQSAPHHPLSKNGETQTVLQSMSIAVYGIHRSMSASELHQMEELQLQQNV